MYVCTYMSVFLQALEMCFIYNPAHQTSFPINLILILVQLYDYTNILLPLAALKFSLAMYMARLKIITLC